MQGLEIWWTPELGGAMRLKEKQGDVETRKGENETQEDMMRNEKKRREGEWMRQDNRHR